MAFRSENDAPSRRDLLTTSGIVALAGMAGCSIGGSGPGTDATTDKDGSTTATSSPTPIPDVGTEVYLSPDGDDSASGSASNPWRTLDRAAEYLKNEVDSTTLEGDVRINLAEGTYRRSEPLKLGPGHSGTTEHRIIFAGPPDGEATISGGEALDLEWEETTVNGVEAWSAPLGSEYSINQLFVNGERRRRPILPETTAEGFETGEMLQPEEWGFFEIDSFEAGEKFSFRSDDVKPEWQSEDASLVLLTDWCDEWTSISEIADDGTVTVDRRTLRIYDFSHNDGFYVVNVKEGLQRPGQWYHDKDAGELLYIPTEGESPDSTTVEIATQDRLLTIAGDGENGDFVENVEFRNLTFEHTTFSVPDQTYAADSQAERQPEAIVLRSTHGGGFYDCSFRHLGAWGMNIHFGCNGVHVVGSEFSSLGGGAIKLGQMRTRLFNNPSTLVGTPRWRRSNGHQISDNHIHQYGQLFHRSVAVNALNTAYDWIAHNHVHDGYYGGLFGGGNPGYDPSIDHDNVYEYNHVHHIMKGLLSDGGGIYQRGQLGETVVRRNYIHDVIHNDYNGCGIYLDLGASHLSIKENVVGKTENAFFIHYGSDASVRNNVFADAHSAVVGYAATKPERPSNAKPISLSNNVLVSDGTPMFIGGYDRSATDEGLVSNNNLLWDRGDNLRFGISGGTQVWDTWEEIHPEQAGSAYGPVSLQFDRNGGTALIESVNTENAESRKGSDAGANDIGFRFTVGDTPVSVTHLGRYVIEGNSNEHTIRIASVETGQMVNGAEATVNTADHAAGGFAYVELDEPVDLAANTKYYLVSSETNADVFLSPVGVESAEGITIDGPAWTFGGSIGALDIDDWRAAGFDTDSIVEDPMFEPNESNPYTLAEESPATEAPVDFDPIDLSNVGIRQRYGLARPWGISTEIANDGTVTIEWGTVLGASGYEVYRQEVGASTKTKITDSPTMSPVTDDSVGVGTYEYWVVAVDEAGNRSPPSGRQHLNTNPAPTNVTADRQDGRAIIRWNPTSVATSYHLMRGRTKDGEFTQINEEPITETSFEDDTIGDRGYFYRVVAIREDGATSEPSATVGIPGAVKSVGEYNQFASANATLEVNGLDDGPPFTMTGTGVIGNEEYADDQTDEYGIVFADGGLGENGSVRVKINSKTRVNFKTIAGIMVKNDVTKPGESLGYVSTFTTEHGNDKFFMGYDSDDTGFLNYGWGQYRASNGDEPYWLRLDKQGTEFTTYLSEDGQSWTEINSATVPSANSTQDVGIFIASNDLEQTTTVEIGEFQLTQ